jgi:segregation and condensation protein A
VDPEDLRQAWLGIISRARANRHHRVTREQLSVREQMTRVLRVLQEAPFAEFRELFSIHGGVAEMVVTFLAILELAKESLVNVTQQAAFAPIYVRLNHGLTAN